MLKTTRRNALKMLAGAAVLPLLRPSFVWADALGTPAKKLRIVNRNIEVNGKAAKVYGLIGEDGKSGLHFTKGEHFKVNLTNESEEDTLIHWHGLTPPNKQDGVPGITQDILKPKNSYDYDFELSHSGTHWMHAHTLQEQALLAAPLIINDPEDSKNDEHEIIMMLHDFSFKSPQELLACLNRPMPADMKMDTNDIEYDAYLANDRTLNDPEIVRVESGGNIRLRIINGSTSTAYTIDLGELNGELIAVDGNAIVPVKGKRFPMTMAQRVDIRIRLPKNNRAYPILALREGAVDQTGIILAPQNAAVKKIADKAKHISPILDLTLEAKLKSLTPFAVRDATLEATYHLHGMMMPYKWFMKRVGAAEGEWLQMKEGDRVKVTLINESMMTHPIHLHGHHFQVIGIDDKTFTGAVRDTVMVLPNTKVTIMFDADNKGKWAFHCHHLYHMVTGMMNFVEYKV
ncbi:MAG: multicopper oxidase family protein [Alphaproteobacteria bacterium]|nr:multicopper oxidase family protein [Alphaproteobacteria bacterium]